MVQVLIVPLHFTMELNLDMAYLGEMESFVDDFIAALWVGERVVSISRLKSGVSRFFPSHHPSKESLHGLIETLQHVLLNLAMDVLVLCSQGFHGRKLVCLHDVGN